MNEVVVDKALRGMALLKVRNIRHWTDRTFSFAADRPAAFRFRSGEFAMIGLMVEGKPLPRAYSIASPSWEEELEFYSIKVEDGPLTSRLQHLVEGGEIVMRPKPVGTLVLDDLKPGKNLYLFGTGTGLAPFMSIIQDPDTYARFDKVILMHGVRVVSEFAYADYITQELPKNEFIGDLIREKLIYYPSATREPFKYQGRLTDLVSSGKLSEDIGLPPLDPAHDRAMICGSPAMLEDTCKLLNERGFVISPAQGVAGDYVIERAFVEK